jgi:hypothetical protein
VKIHHENQKKVLRNWRRALTRNQQKTIKIRRVIFQITRLLYVLTVFYLIIFNQSVRSLFLMFIAGRERDTLEPSWHLWKGGMKESHPTIFDTARPRRLKACQTSTFTVLLHHRCQQRYRLFEVNTIQSERRPQLIFLVIRAEDWSWERFSN